MRGARKVQVEPWTLLHGDAFLVDDERATVREHGRQALCGDLHSSEGERFRVLEKVVTTGKWLEQLGQLLGSYPSRRRINRVAMNERVTRLQRLWPIALDPVTLGHCGDLALGGRARLSRCRFEAFHPRAREQGPRHHAFTSDLEPSVLRELTV